LSARNDPEVQNAANPLVLDFRFHALIGFRLLVKATLEQIGQNQSHGRQFAMRQSLVGGRTTGSEQHQFNRTVSYYGGKK